MQRIYTTIAVIVLAFCAAAVSGCSSSRDTSAMPQPPATPVNLDVLQSRLIDNSSTYVGTMKSRKSVILQPQVSGPITKLFVVSGDSVRAGAPLIQIDPNKQQATLNSMVAGEQSNREALTNAKDLLASLQATRISQEADLKFAQQQYERYRSLNQQGAVSQENVDLYANKLHVCEANIVSTDAQIHAQRALIAKAARTIDQSEASKNEQSVQLHYYTISAPFAGQVGDIPVKLGQYVDPNTKLTTLTENRPIECYVYVPTEKAHELRLGMTMQVIQHDESLIENGKVSFVSPSVSNDNQSVLVKGVFANAGGTLRSEEVVKAKLVWSKQERVMVPTSAVAHFAGQDFVFVAQGRRQMTARQKPVMLGEIIGNEYVVINGISRGERIITSGIQNLADGIPIEVR